MPPLVSILIPAYNAERWIGQSIRSALAQTWQRKEIIVVDDGSSDGTLAAARAFASKEVSIVSQENQGAATARNKALSLCQGDFIQWLDADDLLAPDKVARQMAVLETLGSQRVLLSCAWGRFYHAPTRARFQRTSLWCNLSPEDWLVRKLGENVFMQTGAWLVSRELTQAAGAWDARLLSDDDGEYFCRIILNCDEVQFVPEARLFYRIPGAANLSYVGNSRQKLETLLLSMRLHIAHLRSREDSVRVRAACLQYLQTGLPLFYPECPGLVAQVQQLAADLGGRLDPLRLSWKYVWIEKTLGWTAAKRTQIYYNRMKRIVLRTWDLAHFPAGGDNATTG